MDSFFYSQIFSLKSTWVKIVNSEIPRKRTDSYNIECFLQR